MGWTVIVQLLVALLVGLAVGSFLSVLVLRLPKREPVIWARSRCMRCGHRLTPVELIPLLSWLMQRRRCRACGGAISAFYPTMEIAAALVCVAAAALLPWPALVGACVLGWGLLALTAWEVRRRMLGLERRSRP